MAAFKNARAMFVIPSGELTLVTRPRRQAIILADTLKARDIPVLIEPLLEIHARPEALPDLTKISGLITTSANTIHILATTSVDKALPLWCVGEASADLAKSLGFQKVYAAKGSVKNLLDCLVLENKTEHFLYLRGDVVRFNLKRALSQIGYNIQEACLYQTREAQAFSEETLQAILHGHLRHVLFFSPRTLHVFARLCRAHHCVEACRYLQAVCYGASLAAVAAKGGLPWRKIMLL